MLISNRKLLAAALAISGLLTDVAAQAQTAGTTIAATIPAGFGNYYRPFAADSLWNSRPINPVFGTFVIPTSSYFPAIASGAYSTGVFLAKTSDTPMTVYGIGGVNGVADPDSGVSHTVTLPHWPAGVLPATGTDGHADIVDPTTNILHSFWQLKQVNGKWTASLYSWSDLKGRGWGDPAHYYQGARAVGIPAAAGIIRIHEVADGQPTYKHALAMSLTYNGLANGTTAPSYVFPSTSADNAAVANTGAIPEGALLMLPPTFDTSKISNPDLRKIADTLKLYGAYVVDRNVGTPYAIYVENGANFNLMPKGWDNNVAAQLDSIRAGLRQVVSAASWVDGNGNPMTAQKNLNILSMRGPWFLQAGPQLGVFDSSQQTLVFPATTVRIVQANGNSTGLSKVSWGMPPAGSTQRVTVSATGGAMLRIQVRSGGKQTFDSGNLGDKDSARITWPAGASVVLVATSGVNGPSTVRADLVTAP